MSFSAPESTQGISVSDTAEIFILGLSRAPRSFSLAPCDPNSFLQWRLSRLLVDTAAEDGGVDIGFARYYVALCLEQGKQPQQELGGVVLYASKRSVLQASTSVRDSVNVSCGVKDSPEYVRIGLFFPHPATAARGFLGLAAPSQSLYANASPAYI